MFDPHTVAFRIETPWKNKRGYKNTLITIWHKDPCKDGTDNSCDWFGSKRKLNKKEKAISEIVWRMETTLDNKPFYPDHRAHREFQELKNAIYEWRQRSKFRWHPRWHIHHWRIQVPIFQDIYRYLFEKCCICKKGFKYKESVCGNWDGDNIWHHRCSRETYKN